MNYNNKPKPVHANLLENTMTSNQNNQYTKASRPSGRGVFSSLWLSVFFVTLTAALPSTAYASAGSEANTQKIASKPPVASPAVAKAIAQNSPETLEATVQARMEVQFSELKKEIDNLKRSEEERKQKEAKSDFSWEKILFAILGILGIVGLGLLANKYKQLQTKVDQLTEQNRVNSQSSVNMAKKQQEQVRNTLLKLQNQIVQLEQHVQQQQPSPVPVVSNSNPLTDIPMPQPEFSLSKAPISIDAEDRKILQQAFSDWLANSLTHQFTDFLPKELTRKIEQLGYEILFAKAGLGLNRMIVDRKPPNKTCMVGLSGSNLSLMFCQKKTSQTDDLWRPNAWYEVSIDSPDAADEQTIHQLEELLT